MTRQSSETECYRYSTCLKIEGKTRRSTDDPWETVTCFVSYTDARAHAQIVSDSFQYHLGLDIEYMKIHHRDHFTAPHNVGRAILLYHYFREHFRFFKDEHHEMVAMQHLPDRVPDASGDDFAIWIESVTKQP